MLPYHYFGEIKVLPLIKIIENRKEHMELVEVEELFPKKQFSREDVHVEGSFITELDPLAIQHEVFETEDSWKLIITCYANPDEA